MTLEVNGNRQSYYPSDAPLVTKLHHSRWLAFKVGFKGYLQLWQWCSDGQCE
uniref:Uncharacterized protein n=1 Tax=Anolis carolinensis TaxID=28377 RepID=A0A803SRH0_ANOCA